jgi:predicted P-loop ATPase
MTNKPAPPEWGLLGEALARLDAVEGERDAVTAGELGLLATTSADGAGSWRVEDTQQLIKLGVQKIVICPDHDGPGIDHGIKVAKTFAQTNVEVCWLELPDAKDLSDWAPKQTYPDALLAELMGAAPPFDGDALDWRSQLKMPGRDAGYAYRGDIHNMSLALERDPLLKGCFAWNDFRHRVEVTRRTPWCLDEWWDMAELTPVGHRAMQDADIANLGNYLTKTYDFGPCAMHASRSAIHAVAYSSIFDELKDWIGDLPDWDGTKRLDGWLATYAGADEQIHAKQYLEFIGSRFIMQVLNRALHPGAKADYSLVFTSLQGIGKDRIFEAMFAPYYREGVPSPRVSQADFALAIAGAVVAHGAEMSAWSKSDVEDQKAALTRCVDHGRRAYGYEARSYPRRTCLVFSTNDIEFLQDATGNRRYWVVSIIPGLTLKGCVAIATNSWRRRWRGCRPASGIGRRRRRRRGSSFPSGAITYPRSRWRSPPSWSGSSPRSRKRRGRTVLTSSGNGNRGHNHLASYILTTFSMSASECTRRSSAKGSTGRPRRTSRTARHGSGRTAGKRCRSVCRTVRRYVSGVLQRGTTTPPQNQMILSLGVT